MPNRIALPLRVKDGERRDDSSPPQLGVEELDGRGPSEQPVYEKEGTAAWFPPEYRRRPRFPQRLRCESYLVALRAFAAGVNAHYPHCVAHARSERRDPHD